MAFSVIVELQTLQGFVSTTSADLHDVLVAEHGLALGGGEAEVGEAHGGGQGEGDGEPDQPARDEPPHTLTTAAQCTVGQIIYRNGSYIKMG